MNSKSLLLGLALIAVACGQAPEKTSDLPVYLDDAQPLEARVEDAFSRMTLDEKIAMVHAQSKFSSPGVPRLGIPEVWCTDGPHGIRAEVLWDEWDQAGWTNDSITAFPALSGLAATWDRELSRLYGKSIGEEARYRNKTVLLGPGVNIYRFPLNGRNFEYMGEDPYLAGEMVVPYVEGVQSNGVAVCVKHYALNNSEVNRHVANTIVDDRTLYEIYLPAFKAAVQKGHAWSIMAAYNLYNNEHLCSNEVLLDKILRGEWVFDGVVISDWGGVHNTLQTAKHGVDLEYGSWTDGLTMGKTNAYDSYFLANPYKEAIQKGEIGTEELDARVKRILRLIFRTSMDRNRPFGSQTSPEHYAAARKIGAESIVLLKNDSGILPMVADPKKIVVVGENAVKMMTVGGGSSSLKAKLEVSPLDGIKARWPDAEVIWERGYVGDIGTDYNGVSTGQDLREGRSAATLIADAVKAVEGADYVIFIGGLNKADNQDAEGLDRLQYGLPYNQDAVIEALAAATDKLVVVNISGNAVAMPWVEKVPAIVQDWYLGTQAGHSLADVLSGDVNPSGHLPFTIPVSYADNPVQTEAQYPGILRDTMLDGMPVLDMEYTEGIYVGYRWYDLHGGVLFPFGHGLSYTTFEFGEPTLSKKSMKEDGTVTVTVPVKNTGSVAGSEVVQLYIADVEASVGRPAKELKGFAKVALEPGQKADVQFTIDKDALCFFDAEKHAWVAEKGLFRALVAASAQDVRGTVEFELK
ncbi:MAG: glycoside hydrolase family 3 C-terminal domain-containing protein [Bacteroidales bacterium]|nr:glycoside hydrolase family 3 C-terminal domain-containing protein [Bacteroidales bacterium]